LALLETPHFTLKIDDRNEKIERGKNKENKLYIFNASFIIEKSISLLFPFMKGVQIKI
jgi:hypothetical protein